MQTHRLDLFADYFQFYLQDESVEGNLGDSWTREAVQRLLALAPGTIGVGTVRNMDVPVVVEVHESEPAMDLAEWDHATECSTTFRRAGSSWRAAPTISLTRLESTFALVATAPGFFMETWTRSARTDLRERTTTKSCSGRRQRVRCECSSSGKSKGPARTSAAAPVSTG